MSVRDVENAIVYELAEVTGNYKLRLKHLMEWRTTEIKPQDETEKTVYLPRIKVWATYKYPVSPKKKKGGLDLPTIENAINLLGLEITKKGE